MTNDANKTHDEPRMVKSHDVTLDFEYAEWIADLKGRYRAAQIKAAVKVNAEKLIFNWELGRDLVVRKAEEKWGSGIVEQVSLDLRAEFPDAKGFSARNLWYMKRWYQYYASNNDLEILQQLVSELENGPGAKINQIARVPHSKKLQQAVAELTFPDVFAYVPWGHHIEIITHCKSIEEAAYYIKRTVQEGSLQECWT